MDTSRLRLRIRDLAHERSILEERLLQHERLAKGSLVRVRTRCGQPNCRCKKSRRHRHGPHLYLSLAIRGKTRMVYVPQAWAEQTEAWIKAAQSHRAARRKWLKIQKELWMIFVAMERLKSLPLPYGPKKKG